MRALMVTYSYEVTVSTGELAKVLASGAICIPVRARSSWSRHCLLVRAVVRPFILIDGVGKKKKKK
jgi:hypothetical protein